VAKFFLFLTVVPLLELYLLFSIGAKIGFLPTVAFTILTAALGSALARHQALRVWGDWRASLERLEPPTHTVLEGILILVGGVFLLTPGFLTDGFGFFLLIPWTRKLLLRPFQAAVGRHFRTLRVGRPDGGPVRPDVVDTTAEDLSEEAPVPKGRFLS
jgi:UPF0716 protein FxsA